MRVRRVLAQAALGILALAWAACESTLLSEVVDVEAEGPAPPVLFSRVTTVDTTARVFLLDGARPDDDGLARTLEGAEVVLRVGSRAYGPMEVRPESLYEGFPIQRDTSTTPFVERGVYRVDAPEGLVPGAEVALEVDLPDGTSFALAQAFPPAASARIYEVQPPEVDTFGGFSFSRAPTQVIVKVARPRAEGVNYYRFLARQTFYRDGAPVLTVQRGVGLSDLEEDDTRVLPNGIFSDEGALSDTIQQNLAIDTGLPFGSDFAPSFPGEPTAPPPDSSAVALFLTTLPPASVDYYVALDRARSSARDFFAEPVALTSQAADAGVIAHLVLETWAAGVLRFEGSF